MTTITNICAVCRKLLPLIALLCLGTAMIAEDATPVGDDDKPKSISAEESAKILAEIKAKKDAAKAKAVADGRDPETEAHDKASQVDNWKHKQNAEADDNKAAKAGRDAEALETKAKAAAKNAVRQHDQFMVRAKAEHDGRSEGDIYRVKVVLHESGATNQAVIDAVDKAKDFLAKCDEARTSAGLEPLLTVDKRGKQRDVIEWIIENGR